MNSKWHLIISLVKSVIRMVSCVVAVITWNVTVLAVGLLIAEALGVLEELKDER